MKRVAVVLSLGCFAACSSDEADPAGSGSSSSASTTGIAGSESGELENTSAPEPRADLGVEPSTVCQSYCATAGDCLGASEADCLLGCVVETDERAAVSSDCAAGFEAARVCAAGLECADFGAYQAADGDYLCAAEDQQAALTCSLGGEPPPDLCVQFCTAINDCNIQTTDACTVACVDTRATAADAGAACAQAQDDVLACAAPLACDALDAWLGGTPENPCAPEDEAVASLCTGK